MTVSSRSNSKDVEQYAKQLIKDGFAPVTYIEPYFYQMLYLPFQVVRVLTLLKILEQRKGIIKELMKQAIPKMKEQAELVHWELIAL